MEDPDLPGYSYVLVCGGFDCEVGAEECAGISDRCFTWTPEDNEWTEAPPLNDTRKGMSAIIVRIL